ncbi:MAG: bifunctional heptose 7-phosphate kinase/heptose 1-phosphate adenyltransferase [Planctomycetaceae bacterium]
MISDERLRERLDVFPRLRVGLVGDLFLDRYFRIDPAMQVRSIETGLEAYQVGSVRNSPGAMGTVMSNLTALGVGRVVPVTVIGDDGHGEDLIRQFDEDRVELAHVISDNERLTPTYLKPLKRDAAGTWRELNRFDVRTCEPIAERASKTICRHLHEVFESTDGLIVVDHVGEANWGVVNDVVRAELESLARQQPEKLIFIDSREHIGEFHAGCLKGNEFEVTAAVGGTADPQSATETLARQTGRTAWCTLGEAGMLYAKPDADAVPVPAFAVDGPVDIVGAGDAATSGIVASLIAGASEGEAAVIGNLTASITVAQLGTTGTASPEQLIERLQSER